MRPAMREGTDKFLAQAARAVATAERLLAEGAIDLAAGRAYSGMMYAAKALLNEKGVRRHTHAGVRAAFDIHWAAPGALDRKFLAWLEEAGERRRCGSADDPGLVSDDVNRLVERAREFLEAALRQVGMTK